MAESTAVRRRTVAALLTLTAVTGLVDAVSYLRLGHVFAANMTGNVVFLGFSVVRSSGIDPVGPLVTIAAFLAGSLAGGRAGAQLDARPRTWLSAVFGTQAAVLAVVAALAGTGVLSTEGRRALVILAVLAATFGLQNATVRRLAAPDLTTTVLTLTLTGLAADSVLAGGKGAKPHRRVGSVLAMLGGAALGALLLQVTFAGVIALGAAAVAAVALLFGLGPRQAEAVDPAAGTGAPPATERSTA
jgi:uncharacterized membrane protein YoaK (UPF0700 family)